MGFCRDSVKQKLKSCGRALRCLKRRARADPAPSRTCGSAAARPGKRAVVNLPIGFEPEGSHERRHVGAYIGFAVPANVAARVVAAPR